MATAAATEKTAEELRKEIDELHRKQREITDRLRDPRGLRRANALPRPNGPGLGPVPRLRGFVPPAPVPEDQPTLKKRLLSAVVKVDNGEAKPEVADAAKEQDLVVEGKPVLVVAETNSARPRAFNPPDNGGAGRNDFHTWRRSEFDLPLPEPLPRVLPKDEDARVVKRNQRMLGQILGTLQKFQQEDQKLSTTEAFMRRSDSLCRDHAALGHLPRYLATSTLQGMIVSRPSVALLTSLGM